MITWHMVTASGPHVVQLAAARLQKPEIYIAAHNVIGVFA